MSTGRSALVNAGRRSRLPIGSAPVRLGVQPTLGVQLISANRRRQGVDDLPGRPDRTSHQPGRGHRRTLMSAEFASRSSSGSAPAAGKPAGHITTSSIRAGQTRVGWRSSRVIGGHQGLHITSEPGCCAVELGDRCVRRPRRLEPGEQMVDTGTAAYVTDPGTPTTADGRPHSTT